MSGSNGASRIVGLIKWFSPAKGYGFISPEGGGPDVFVHNTDVEKSGLKDGLSDGDRVTFDTVPGKPGKGPKAVNIAVV